MACVYGSLSVTIEIYQLQRTKCVLTISSSSYSRKCHWITIEPPSSRRDGCTSSVHFFFLLVLSVRGNCENNIIASLHFTHFIQYLWKSAVHSIFFFYHFLSFFFKAVLLAKVLSLKRRS